MVDAQNLSAEEQGLLGRVDEAFHDTSERMVKAIEAGDDGAKADAMFDGALLAFLRGDIADDQHSKDGAMVIIQKLIDGQMKK